jgi:hypothetical protein
MLGWLLLGALLTATVIIISVSYLDKKVAKEKLKEKNIEKCFVKEIVISESVTHIKLDAIDTEGNEQEVEIEADDYNSSEIRKGMIIVT